MDIIVGCFGHLSFLLAIYQLHKSVSILSGQLKIVFFQKKVYRLSTFYHSRYPTGKI